MCKGITDQYWVRDNYKGLIVCQETRDSVAGDNEQCIGTQA